MDTFSLRFMEKNIYTEENLLKTAVIFEKKNLSFYSFISNTNSFSAKTPKLTQNHILQIKQV